MMCSLKHIKTDLDKLTEDDIDDYKRAIGSRTRKDGTPIAKSSAKYFAAFRQFLRWCGKKYKNPENAFFNLLYEF